MIRLFTALLLAAACALPAFAQPANSAIYRHALTPSMIEKANAAHRELEKLYKKKDTEEDAEWDDKTIDRVVREIESIPGTKPILAKHGLTARNYLLTTLATIDAAIFIASEASAGKQKAAAEFATFTPQKRANIELLRKNPKLASE
jgi:hypothetical protein